MLKDSVKEIKNTYKRFISILLMAFLGVGFFAGMRAASPDMVDTINQYYKDTQVYDVQILSTLGLTNQDIKEITKIENVENVIGTYEIDGKLEIENKEVIAKIMCIEEMNQPILLQGELPKNQEECVVEESFLKRNHKEIGDTIEIKVEKMKNTEGEEEQYLNQNKLKIVGTVKSPVYIARDRGTSNLGSGKIDYYMYITRENIKANEIYTNLYIKIKDAEKYTTSSHQYNKCIEEVKEKIENIKEERQQARHNELVSKATEKVEKSEEEFNTEKKNAEEKLEEARRKITEGKTKIQEAENTINSNKKQADIQFANAYKQIQTAKKKIEENEKQLLIKEQEATQQLKELEEQEQKLQMQLQTVMNGIETLELQYQQIKDNPLITEEQKQALAIQIQKLEQSKQTVQAAITEINKGVAIGKQEIQNGKEQIQKAKYELSKQEKQY